MYPSGESMTSTPPGVSAALIHPSGSRVYLVGVAHVSAKGQTAYMLLILSDDAASMSLPDHRLICMVQCPAMRCHILICLRSLCCSGGGCGVMHPGGATSRRGAGAGREAVQEADAERSQQRPLPGAADGTWRRPEGDTEVIIVESAPCATSTALQCAQLHLRCADKHTPVV